MSRLIQLYAELSAITHEICQTCEPPFHCCSEVGCSRAQWWAKHAWGVDLQKTNLPKPVLQTDIAGAHGPNKSVSCGIAAGRHDRSPVPSYEGVSSPASGAYVGEQQAPSPKDRDTADHGDVPAGLPYLTKSGCTVAPHHRPVCSTYLCKDKERPPRYQELMAEIAKLESERLK